MESKAKLEKQKANRKTKKKIDLKKKKFQNLIHGFFLLKVKSFH